MSFLKKIQDKPLHTKKAILWSTLIVVGVLLGAWWVKIAGNAIKEPRDFNFLIPDLSSDEAGFEFPSLDLSPIGEMQETWKNIKTFEQEFERLSEEEQENLMKEMEGLSEEEIIELMKTMEGFKKEEEVEENGEEGLEENKEEMP